LLATVTRMKPVSVIGVIATVTVLTSAAIAVPTAAAATKTPGYGATASSWVKAYKVRKGPGKLCNQTYQCFGAPVKNTTMGTWGYTFMDVLVNTAAKSKPKPTDLVFTWTEEFSDTTSITVAEQAVMKLVPPDSTATPVAVINEPDSGLNGAQSCAYINITGPTITQILNASGPWPPGVTEPSGIGVIFESVGKNLDAYYKAGDVQQAEVDQGLIDPTANSNC
jgi:hypothetical protein